jgi:hypothetical protein
MLRKARIGKWVNLLIQEQTFLFGMVIHGIMAKGYKNKNSFSTKHKIKNNSCK